VYNASEAGVKSRRETRLSSAPLNSVPPQLVWSGTTTLARGREVNPDLLWSCLPVIHSDPSRRALLVPSPGGW
jgi:hypothetical protein